MCDSANTGCFFSRSSKENGRSVPDLTASPGRAPPGPMPQNQQNSTQRQGVKEPVLLQGDFRKVSGISSEIFRQIEAVENDHDPSTAAALEAVERRGEMIVRILEPRCIGGRHAVDAAQKLMTKGDARHIVQLVEIVKRPGQTLGLYIREGNGADRSDGVFISRIALESAVYNSGCLRVGDEILAVNLVDVTRMSLDDVVIIMSIPRRLVLAIRQRRGGRGANSPGPPPLSRPEQKPPPVVVIKRDLRDEDMDEIDRAPRSRSSRERRTGDGREMTESRSRLGLGLNNYSPQSEQLDLYYNSRPNAVAETPSWGYKPPPPPSVITEQPKGATHHGFQTSHSYYQNAGTLESLAEKVHSFYPGPSRRMSAGTGVSLSQSHQRFPRSGSDQHLPRVEYTDYASLGRQSLLRSSLKSGPPAVGGTLGRYGRYEPQSSRTPKYGNTGASTLTRRSRPTLDYSSDTEATIGPRPGYYYYNNTHRPPMGSIPRGSTTALGGGPEFAKFNSLPRDRPGARLGLRSRLGDRLVDENDGNLSAPEYSLPTRRDRVNDLRNRITASPSIFTSDEYRAWLRRAPSSSAICEQMRASRDILNQQRAHRFSCSAENIHDALKNTENIYSSRTGLTGTLDRHNMGNRGISSLPVRSLSSQHLGGPSSIRSPSVRRMRQLLELSAGSQSPSGMSGHQSPAPTPSATLPRSHRQLDINPAEFVKYKLDKPVLDTVGVSGMLWIHLLAGRGLRTTPEGTQTSQAQMRDLYCVLECDRVHKARTVVRSGDLQFDWDESFELDLVCNKQLDVLVYSWDPQHRHKLCYRGAISLTTILRQSPIHQLALKVEPRGTIYLRVRHTDPVQLYRRRGLPSLRGSCPALFGADLETVVTREAKGAPGSAPVPIVLRRCVEEVERRGLDIIGLYRLCGSATKKRLLREAFERNSRAVELSPDHVPDINVITGVLKDYLRELPEPLFTRCLFQMTVDALGVCLPDDPEGNAKLMLSILDCLPRANRATLVFLLDHLSLVVSASERNKMSAQALATALGPPLMLHSSATSPEDFDHAQPIAVLKYLLQIWPQPHQAANSSISGRRGEPAGPRGNKVSALQVGKQQINHHISNSAVSNLSIGHHQLLATPSNHQYQSVVGQLAQSPRVLQQVAQQHHQLGASAVSGERAQSPPLVTPSPSSSSSSTSGSGSGTDTVKRGVSPAASISSATKFRESNSNYSMKHEQSISSIKNILSSSSSTSATPNNKYNIDANNLDDVNRDAVEKSEKRIASYSSKLREGSTISASELLPSKSVLFSTDLIASPSSSLLLSSSSSSAALATGAGTAPASGATSSNYYVKDTYKTTSTSASASTTQPTAASSLLSNNINNITNKSNSMLSSYTSASASCSPPSTTTSGYSSMSATSASSSPSSSLSSSQLRNLQTKNYDPSTSTNITDYIKNQSLGSYHFPSKNLIKTSTNPDDMSFRKMASSSTSSATSSPSRTIMTNINNTTNNSNINTNNNTNTLPLNLGRNNNNHNNNTNALYQTDNYSSSLLNSKQNSTTATTNYTSPGIMQQMQQQQQLVHQQQLQQLQQQHQQHQQQTSASVLASASAAASSASSSLSSILTAPPPATTTTATASALTATASTTSAASALSSASYAPSSSTSSQISTNNLGMIYGTLPKSSTYGSNGASSLGSGNASSFNASAASNANVNYGTNDSSNLITGNGSNSSNNFYGNYGNTIGPSYRVQYSSTNPFLPTYNPPPADTTTSSSSSSVSPVPLPQTSSSSSSVAAASSSSFASSSATIQGGGGAGTGASSSSASSTSYHLPSSSSYLQQQHSDE